jgi:hypothetical protein
MIASSAVIWVGPQNCERSDRAGRRLIASRPYTPSRSLTVAVLPNGVVRPLRREQRAAIIQHLSDIKRHNPQMGLGRLKAKRPPMGLAPGRWPLAARKRIVPRARRPGGHSFWTAELFTNLLSSSRLERRNSMVASDESVCP